MSTKKSSPRGKQGQTGPAKDTGAGKKRKSAGFIETSDYKPNWLETGPLSPEMLPDALPNEESRLTTDEFDALQQSLRQFYEQEGLKEPEAQTSDAAQEAGSQGDEADEMAPVEAKDAPEFIDDLAVVVTEAEHLDEEEVPLPSNEAIEADVSPEVEPLPPPAPPEPWIEPLLHREETGEEIALVSPSPFLAEPEVSDPAADTFIDPIWDAEPEAEETQMPAAPAVAGERASTPKRKTEKPHHRGVIVLFILSLLLIGAATLIYFVNPFTRLALGSASLARPLASPSTGSPRSGSGSWCVQGDFQAASATPLRLIDSGAEGDILAEDNVYSLEHVIGAPGAYEWQVIDCENTDLVFPEAPAWVTTTEPDQPVTFIFDSNQREDRLFFPIPYVVSAVDSADNFQIVGSFQEWNPNDPAGRLEPISIGLYQQVRRIARAGDYQGYVVAGDEDLAIDAYGRTTQPIPFSFQTDRNGDFVVFLVDTDRGRASVMYDMPPVFTSLAFGNGYRLLSLALTILASLILLGLLLRFLILNNLNLQLESGCPNCGYHELMRIARRPSDRLLHMFGIPAYRYRCRHCTWEGMRLSDDGATISPGAVTATNTRF